MSWTTLFSVCSVQSHFQEHVYTFSRAAHYFSTRFPRFPPHPGCMGPLSAPCRWKVRGGAAKPRRKQMDSFSSRSHIGAISKTAVPLPGVPKLSLLICLSPSFTLSIPSTLLVADLQKKYPKENERAHQSGPEKKTCLTEPLLLFTPYWSYQPPEDALLSHGLQLIRADDFSAPTYLTHSGHVCA